MLQRLGEMPQPSSAASYVTPVSIMIKSGVKQCFNGTKVMLLLHPQSNKAHEVFSLLALATNNTHKSNEFQNKLVTSQ
ncbi:hypothetical protein [Photobacterium profundum]|uniref:hypothetical protein n=1 Tax=Photobacterium profundum TaxID=74109 RepID=UPI0002E2FA40|nr:hypothetical protein [Photobacterium profundum]